MDDSTTISELRTMVKQFVDERDWQQFHSPKNLSMAMAIEVSELMEHFQWISTEESRNNHKVEPAATAIREELSDVFCYVLALANEMEIDLAKELELKMVKNREKYPVDKYQGNF